MNVVHAERITAPHKTQEVIHIAAVVAVVKRHPRGIHTLILQDDSKTLASAIGCIGMNTNWHPSRLAGTNRGPQPYFFKAGWLFGNDPYLDHARLDAGAVNALLNFFFEELGKAWNRAGRHGYVRNRREKTLAGTRDHVNSGFAGDLFEKANIAPDIIRGQVDDGADACSSDKFEFFDGFNDKFCSAAPVLRPFAQIVCLGNMFVRESESEFRRIERPYNRLSSTSMARWPIYTCGF